MDVYEIEIIKYPQKRPLNNVQITIWKDLLQQKSIFMYELWFEHLSFMNRIQIWNSVNFSIKHFMTLSIDNEKLQELQDQDDFDQKKILEEISDLELKEFVEVIFKEYKIVTSTVDQSNKSQFKSLFKKCVKLSDYRSCVWF